MEAYWKQSGSKVEAKWRQSEVLGYMCLLAKEVPHEEYKRGPVSMKNQDSLWIINTLDWYYKFSKSIVISFFPLSYLLLLSSQSLQRLCQTPDIWPFPSNQGRTDLVHVCPTPSLRGLNNLSNLRLYDNSIGTRYPRVASVTTRRAGKSEFRLLGIVITQRSHIFER